MPLSSANAKKVDFAIPRSGTCWRILRSALRTAGTFCFGIAVLAELLREKLGQLLRAFGEAALDLGDVLAP